MNLAALAAAAIVILLAAAVLLGLLTVLGRVLRRAGERRRARLAAPTRRLLVRLTAGDDEPDLVDRLAVVDARVWRAVEPTAVAMLGKVRGEAHAALVEVFVRRGAADRAGRDLRARGAVRRARAAEVLGNLGGRAHLPALCDLLTDHHPDVRVVAARALGRIGDPAAARPLLDAAAGRTAIPAQIVAHALLRLGVGAHVEVQQGLDHPAELVRATAVEVLGLLGAVGAAYRVEIALRGDPSPEVRVRAARTLGRLGTRSALAPLLATIDAGRSTALRAAAAGALGELGSPAAAEPLAALLTDPSYRVAHDAAHALLRLGPTGRAALRDAARRAPTHGGDATARHRAGAHAREALALDDLLANRRAPAAAAA